MCGFKNSTTTRMVYQKISGATNLFDNANLQQVNGRIVMVLSAFHDNRIYDKTVTIDAVKF